jgi:hypothetical protein
MEAILLWRSMIFFKSLSCVIAGQRALAIFGSLLWGRTLGKFRKIFSLHYHIQLHQSKEDVLTVPACTIDLSTDGQL